MESTMNTKGTTGLPEKQRAIQSEEERVKMRDHFAGLAMQGLIAIGTPMNYVVQEAYGYADAMLRAREAGQ